MQVREKRRVGQTKLEVSILGFGGAPLGNLYRPIAEQEARATVQAAANAGICYFDTAPLYGYGLSEHRVGAALREHDRSDFVLSTKVGRLLVPDDPAHIDAGQFPGCLPFRGVYDYSYDGIMRSLEDSLQRLGLHRVDILLIHDIDVWTHGSEAATEQRFTEVMNGGYKALEKLRSEGVVHAIGAGVNEWQICERFARAGDFDCFLLAGRYTLLEQASLNSFLPLCEEKSISVVIGGPYNTGILATGAVDGAYYNYQPASTEILAKVKRMEAVCADHGVSLASAALQFPLHHPNVASVIPGARSAEEVRSNVELLEAPIPDSLWSDFKETGLLRADAPTP
jgi:D-threo-aldose 1-dehydrogenase